MDRRSSYPYSRRSKPQRSYAEDDDDDDVVLAAEIDDDDSDNDDDDDDIGGDDDVNDEDYNVGSARHQRRQQQQQQQQQQQHRLSTRHTRKHRKLSSCNNDINNNNYQIASKSCEIWSEKATFVLLEIWGERFLQLGRSSLRNEDWSDVAERVSDATRMKLGVSECRNRLNSLKMRYKREKSKLGGGSGLGLGLGGGISKWVYFKKMDALMTMSPRQLQQQEQCGLACGVDSGEFVFMNPRVYLDHSNALDEMRDSPGNSEDEEDEEEEEEEDEDEDEEVEEVDEESYRMLSESIKRVGEIYEKIEDSKRQHMMELERMRGEFQRELELQKKEMIDRTRAEIAKLSNGDDEDSGYSAENVE